MYREGRQVSDHVALTYICDVPPYRMAVGFHTWVGYNVIPRFGEFRSCCVNLPEKFSQPGDLF